MDDYGAGFSRANLFHMMRFAEAFPRQRIVYALSRQLGWTHFRRIIYLDDPLQRDFYAEMCRAYLGLEHMGSGPVGRLLGPGRSDVLL